MYVKFVRGTLKSSLNDEPLPVRWTFFTCCLLADWDGYFTSTVSGIAREANVPLQDVQAALETLQAPDCNSTTPDDDGIRLKRLGNNNWFVVNIAKYRGKDDLEGRRSVDRERQARRREKNHNNNDMSRDREGLSRDGHVTSRHKEEDKEEDKDRTLEHIGSNEPRTNRKEDAGVNPAVTVELSEVERKKKEKEEKAKARAEAKTKAAASLQPDVEALFDFWTEVMRKTGAKLSPKRQKRIEWALKEYGEKRARKAIIGCASSAFHTGENEHGKRFDDLELIFRNHEKFEAFEALGEVARVYMDAETGATVVTVTPPEEKNRRTTAPKVSNSTCDKFGNEYGVIGAARAAGLLNDDGSWKDDV